MVNLLALNLITQLISPDALDKLIDSRTVTLSQTKSYGEVERDRFIDRTLAVCLASILPQQERQGAPMKRRGNWNFLQSSVYLSSYLLLSSYLPNRHSVWSNATQGFGLPPFRRVSLSLGLLPLSRQLTPTPFLLDQWRYLLLFFPTTTMDKLDR